MHKPPDIGDTSQLSGLEHLVSRSQWEGAMGSMTFREAAFASVAPDEVCSERLNVLELAMNSLLALLRKTFPDSGARPSIRSTAQGVSHAELEDVKKLVTEALESNSFRTYQLIREHEKSLTKILGDCYFDLRSASDKFDFDSAMKVWRKCVVEIGN